MIEGFWTLLKWRYLVDMFSLVNDSNLECGDFFWDISNSNNQYSIPNLGFVNEQPWFGGNDSWRVNQVNTFHSQWMIRSTFQRHQAQIWENGKYHTYPQLALCMIVVKPDTVNRTLQ